LREASATGRLPERLERIDAVVRRAEDLLTAWAESIDELAAQAEAERRLFEAERARFAVEHERLETECRRYKVEWEEACSMVSLLRSELDVAREEIAAGHARLQISSARLAERLEALEEAEAEARRLREERDRAQALADALQRLRVFRYSKWLRGAWGAWLRLTASDGSRC
jgi:DNA repair exonuclease SbcCD ATPase subunit